MFMAASAAVTMMVDDEIFARCMCALERRGLSGSGRFGAEDLACLQVALMVAALDGRILPREYEMFDQLANRCDGATREKVDSALDTALRSAGYLLLLSGRLSASALSERFADEALKLLKTDLGALDPAHLRGAFEMWVAMAESDGDFSVVERTCLRALFERLREDLAEREMRVLEASRFRRFGGDGGSATARLVRSRVDDLLPPDLLRQV